MSKKCRIIFKNGVKTSVQDKNGKESKLFNEIIGQSHVESFDQALEIFQNIYAKEFEEGTFYNNADVRFQIIGEKGAQNLDQYKQSLNEAKELEKQGVDYNTIEDKTKWYKFKGQWRKLATEVIDSFTLQNNTKNKILTLKQVIGDENILFTFYPQINDIKVVFLDTTLPMVGITAPNIIEKSNGAYDERDRTIFINTRITKNEKYTLAHEISHVIQGVEGFAKGGNSESILSETLSILGIEEGTLVETYNLIKQADKSKLTENERKIVEASYATIEAIYKDDNLTLSKQYSQILGEIDANVVEGTLKIKDNQKVTVTSYRELLNVYLSGRKIDVNSIFLLRNGGIKFQIIGEKGAQNLDQAQEATYRIDNLKVAKEMEVKFNLTSDDWQTTNKNKQNKLKILLATGWQKGADLMWKYEILDGTFNEEVLSDSRLVEGTDVIYEYSILDFFNNKELFTAIPQLKDTKVYFFNGGKEQEEMQMGTDDVSIFINNNYYGLSKGDRLFSKDEQRISFLHELQHLSQNFEGFQKGGNSQQYSTRVREYFTKISKTSNTGDRETILQEEFGRFLQESINKNNDIFLEKDIIKIASNPILSKVTADMVGLDMYYKLMGEVEARNVEERANMTVKERRKKLLEETESVDREDQIFIVNTLDNIMQLKTNQKELQFFAEQLEKTKLAKSVNILSSQDIEQELVKRGNENVALTTNGFVDLKTQEVFLNKDTANGSTFIHEYQHIYSKWLQENRKEVYEKGLSLIEEELNKDNSEIQSVIDYVRQTQPNLQGEALNDEILTELIGRKGYELVKEQSGILDWIKEVWESLKDLLGLSNYTLDQIMQMDLNEFAKASAIDLTKGFKIEQPLFYQAQDGKNYTTYKEALLKTNEGVVKVGTLENDKFKEQYSVDVTSDNNTFGGKINSLIRMNYLTGETYFDDKGNKIHRTKGKSTVKKALVAEEVKTYFKRGSKILANGDVTLTDTSLTISKNDGTKQVFKQEELTQKTFQELEKEFQDPIGIIGVLEIPQENVKQDLEIVPENELQLKLLSFLKKLGVRTLDISSYLEQYQNKYYVAPSANALANIAEQVIAFRDGLIKVEDLAEETAHFIIAATPIEQKENILRNINKTQEWLEFSEEYREIYGQTLSGQELENIVREEILGKVLANALQRQFVQEENHSDTQKSIVSKLLEVLQNFFNKVNAFFQDDFRNELDTFTDQIYNNLMAETLEANTSNFKDYKFNMFSVKRGFEEEKVLSILNRAADYLKIQENQLTKGKNSLNKEQLKALKQIAEQQIVNETMSAIETVSAIANNQVSHLERSIKKSIDSKIDVSYPLTQAENAVFMTFDKKLSPVLSELIARLDINNSLHKKLITQIESVQARFNRVKGSVAIKENITLEALININIEKHQYTKQQAQEYRDFMLAQQKDTAWFHANLGTLVNARDPLLGLASGVINRSIIEQRDGYLGDIKPLANLMDKLKITGGRLKDLVAGSYQVNEVDLNLYDEVILEETVSIFNKVKGTTLTVVEFVKLKKDGLTDEKGIDANRLNPTQTTDFYNQVKEFENNFRENAFKDEFLEQQEKLFQDIDENALKFHKINRRMIADIFANAPKINKRTILDSNATYDIKRLNKDRAFNANPRNPNGTLKKGLSEKLVDGKFELEIDENKADKDSRLAFGLYQIAKITQAQFPKGEGKKDIPDIFIKMLNDNATFQGLSKDQQLEFLFNNAYVGFADEFWANFGKEDSNYVKLINIGEKELADEIRNQEQIVSAILKQNRVPNRPSETNVSEMDIEERNAVKDANEELEELYQKAKTKLKDVNKKDEENTPFFENKVNDSYVDDLFDLEIKTVEAELEFIKSHTTKNGKKAINKYEGFINSYSKGDTISEYYKNFVNESMTKEEMQATLIPFAQSRILPYYKRIEPQTFSQLMASVRDENGISVEDFIKSDLVNVTPNYSFYDVQQNDNINPKFLENKKLGKVQIKRGNIIVNGKIYNFDSKQFTTLFGNVVNEVPEKNKELWQVRQALLEMHKKTLSKYEATDSHNLYLLPQKGKQGMRQIQDLLQKRDKVTATEMLKDFISFREDEQEFGRPFGSIPQYYLNKLENQGDVSDDLLYTYSLMNQQANLYQARVNNIGDMFAIEMALQNEDRYKGNKATNTLKMFKSYMDYNFFGVKETYTYSVTLPGGHKVDLAAIARRFHKWIQLVNLTGLIIPTTSLLQGTIVKKIESLVGETINSTASSLANREFRRLAPSAMGEVLQINSKSKLNVMMEALGVYDIVGNRFEDSVYSKAGRGVKKWAQITHEFANFPVIPRTALAVMFDYRYVTVNGEKTIMNLNEFQRNSQGKSRKDSLKEWKTFDLFYDDIKVEDGLMSFDKASIAKKGVAATGQALDNLLKNVKENMTNRTSQAIQRIDSQIPAHEKSMAARHGIAAFFLLHSNWFLLAIQQRFKSRGYNDNTGNKEEGVYLTIKDFAAKMTFGFDKKAGKTWLKHIKDTWTDSMNDDTTRRNLHRATLDMTFVATMQVLGFLLSNYMDDDDDPLYALQLTEYMLYRVTNEQISSTVALPNQFLKALDSPIKGIDRLTDLGSLVTGVLFDGDIVERGRFAGETERARYLYNNVPGLKDIYNLRNIEGTKNSYKHFNSDNEPWSILSYELLKEDEE